MKSHGKTKKNKKSVFSCSQGMKFRLEREDFSQHLGHLTLRNSSIPLQYSQFWVSESMALHSMLVFFFWWNRPGALFPNMTRNRIGHQASEAFPEPKWCQVASCCYIWFCEEKVRKSPWSDSHFFFFGEHHDVWTRILASTENVRRPSQETAPLSVSMGTRFGGCFASAMCWVLVIDVIYLLICTPA